MQSESIQEPLYNSYDFLRSPIIKWLILVFLFVSAFGVRLYHIDVPPLDFSPVRQYQAAHNARAYYFNSLESISEERRKIAAINMSRMEFKLEPRIMEQLAVFGYRIAGRELLWIPRVLSSLFWIVGGIFLFFIAKKLTTFNSAVFSAAYFIFMPYSILASRSFQPDPLMLMMVIISIYTILLHHEQQSITRLLLALSASALAMIIKPYCVFLIFGVFLPLAIQRQGIRKTALNPHVLLFSFFSVAPSFIYYSYNTLIQGGDAQLLAQITFLPYLYLRPYFWIDWLVMIGRSIGYIAFTGALLGLLMSRGLFRKVLIGLWIGYFLFGMIFTFHIHTHEYYQLQLIPIVALSLIPVVTMIINKSLYLFTSKRHMFFLVTLLIVLISVTGYFINRLNLNDYKTYLKPLGAVIGVNPKFYKFITEDYKKEVSAAQEIGEIVRHSTNNVFLTDDYGRSLSYHAELSGLPWPISRSLRNRKEKDIPIPDKEELFNARYLTIRTHKTELFNSKITHGSYIHYKPDYFIVTAFEEFDKQPDLKKFLYRNFPIKAQTNDYLIFDLRKMSE